jgi:hypothetical protein
MTTVVPFVPSNLRTPSFIATLDGVDHNIEITWNVAALRYYVNVYRQDNNAWIITVPLIASPPGRGVSSAVYDPFLNAVVVKFLDPSLWPLPLGAGIAKPGTIIEYTLEEFQPNTYNGRYRCLHLNDTTFTFPMPQNPGPLIVMGRVSRLLNMVDTVFRTSTMVYRNGAFEINP